MTYDSSRGVVVTAQGGSLSLMQGFRQEDLSWPALFASRLPSGPPPPHC